MAPPTNNKPERVLERLRRLACASLLALPSLAAAAPLAWITNQGMKEAGPIPVTNYSSTFTVKPGSAAGTALVEWRGAFYRGSPNNDPPPDKNDEAAVAAVTGIYKSGLSNLKAVVEKR